jgi:plastocyanin
MNVINMKKIIYVLGLISILLLIAGCAKDAATSTAVPETTGNAPTTEKALPETPKVTESVPAPSTAGEIHNVMVEDFKFLPADLEVKAGDTVEWTNKDSAEHTITFDDGSANEKLPAGGTVSHTFTKKGTFTYYCALHPKMVGTVAVG